MLILAASATQETKKLAKAIDRFSTHVFSIGRDSSSEPGGHSIDLVTAIDLALRTITAWINQTTAKRLDAWDDVVGKLLTPHRRMLDASLYTTFAFLDRQLAGIELDRKAAQVRELCEDIETLSASIQELSQTLEEPEIGELRKLLDRYERILKEQGSNRLTDSITAYFYGEYLNVANDKTAGSVAMVAGTMIMMFTQSPFDRMFAPGGTFNFNEVLDAGKIVYLDMPTAQYKVKQTIAAIALKLDFFRTMLMRPRARVLLPDGTLGKRLVNQTRFMTYFSDEFGNVATTGVGTGEASCMQEVREWRCGFILGYQSLTVLLQRLPKNEVDSQLTNTRTEVFLNNADEETGKHAAAKLGKKYRVQFNVHKGAGSMFGEQRIGERPYSTSYSYQHRFDPAALADLKKGEAILALPQRFNRHRVFKAQLSNAKIVVSDQIASDIRALVPPAKRRTPT